MIFYNCIVFKTFKLQSPGVEDLAQVVERLLSKCKVLNLSPSTQKVNKK